MAKIDLTKTELVWLGKYDDAGKLKPVEKPGPYPFQIVEAINEPRKGSPRLEKQTLFDCYRGDEGQTFEEGWKNKLIWGDNKLVMSSLLEKCAGRINLIYIDPPFATGADFKFKIQVGEKAEEITKEHSIIEEKAYRDTWGKGFDSYLHMMYERLVLMKELLAENGSIYVHLDWHLGHYVKIMMDEIFRYDNFRNEIVVKRIKKNVSEYEMVKSLNTDQDVVLFYSKSSETRLSPPIRELAKEPRWHSFEASGYRTGMDYVLFGFKPNSGNHWRWTKERATEAIEQGILRPNPRTGKPEYLVIKEEEVIGTIWDDISAYSFGYQFSTEKSETLLRRIITISSNPGGLVADFFCGSGTTLAVAEKLGRRWIGCDLSRYAIHITRKRLLEIENSKELADEAKGKYGRKSRPFEILNLGKYERQLWQVKTFDNRDERQVLYEYLAFILKLYGAEPIAGFTHIHGKRANALVYVGAVDSPVTIQEVLDAIQDCKSADQKELHILGWEWEMGLNDAIQDIAKREKINLKLRIIPHEVLDKQAVERGDVRFFELAHFKVDIKVNKKTVNIQLKDFVIPHTDLIPDEVKDKIKKWSDWIDYWAVDFDFQNDTFNNGWTSYRTKKDREIEYRASHPYDNEGKYKIFVKVIDIFGIDTSQIFEVEVK
jgi:adenine-specific DNA-methyltransferase